MFDMDGNTSNPYGWLSHGQTRSLICSVNLMLYLAPAKMNER